MANWVVSGGNVLVVAFGVFIPEMRVAALHVRDVASELMGPMLMMNQLMARKLTKRTKEPYDETEHDVA